MWTNVLQQLKKDLSETTITTWFDELTAVDIRENTFYLHCPNDFKKRYIESLFIKNIKAALQDLWMKRDFWNFRAARPRKTAIASPTRISRLRPSW